MQNPFRSLKNKPRFFHTMLLAVVSCLWGCPSADREPEYPPGVVKPDEFAALIADFALAESAANLNIQQLPVHFTDSAYAFNPLAEHGITPAGYDSSLKFYLRHPKLHKLVYEKVLERLSRLEAARDTLKK